MSVGMGVMLHALSGGSPHRVPEYVGKRILGAEQQGNTLRLMLEGVTIAISDQGQSCCEYRYMRTDDDLSALVGRVLTGIEEAPEAPTRDVSEYGDVKEAMFLNILTDQGLGAQFSFHNEHNGYYGGFSLSIAEVEP